MPNNDRAQTPDRRAADDTRGDDAGAGESDQRIRETRHQPWHTRSAEDALGEFDSSQSGLSESDAEARLEKHGPNAIAEDEKVSPWPVLLNQFTSPLIYVLIGALIVTLSLQRWSDSIVIALVLIVNAVVGFFQEYRAQRAIEALMEMVSPKAAVRRDGSEREIDSDRLVPGDIVLLSEGEVVPADLRLIESASLQINEAALTGESVPASKRAEAMEGADEDLPPAEIENMAYMGAAVTSGHGFGVVVATGRDTEVGQIAESIRSAGEKKTPLQKRIDFLARALAVGILFIAAVAFGVGLLMGNTASEMFVLAVAVAVAAMPEGLPVVMTVALAVGVRRMARRNAVIRHLPAVETLGSCTAIVSDKTGTITRNQMTVRQIHAGDRRTQLSGPALDIDGEFTQDDQPIEIEERSPLWFSLLVGTLNNAAELEERSGSRDESTDDTDDDAEDGQASAPARFKPSGDPTEVALLIAGMKAGLDREKLLETYERTDEVPFKTERRFSASMHRDPDGQSPLVCVKGAPEVVLEMCENRMSDSGDAAELDRDALRDALDEMAASGLRLLAMAVGRGEHAAESIRSDDPSGFTLVGVQGLLDPPRKSAREAIDNCHSAGIRVLMVTGDHVRTAAAIGRRVHIDRPVRAGAEPQDRDENDEELPEVRTGRDIADLSDEKLDETLDSVNVYARFKPDQKLRLVRRLRERGGIVAVTGDGVNDAPALKEADLGVAMGRAGTDVAKEASDMVITDDNFASVYAAVEEGRTSFRNIRMATFFLLSTGAADVLVILAALLAGWALPLLPAQILWCNVVTNGIADVALGFEPGEKSLFRRPPRSPNEGILNRDILERLAIIGVWLAAGVLGVFYWLHFVREESIEVARTAALTTLVLFQKVHVFNCRSEGDSVFTKSPLRNKVLLVGVLASLAIHIAAIYTPWTQTLLSITPVGWDVWLVMIVVAATAIIPNELHKRWGRARRARN